MKKGIKKKLINLVDRISENIKSERVTRPLQTSNINFPDRIPTDVPDAFPKFINRSLRIAALLSDEMYSNLKYECLLINMNKSNILKVFKKKHLPSFLLVESQCFYQKNLKYIIQRFKSKNIPAVLWVTTPLDSVIRHKDILHLFKLVFSTDPCNIAALQELAHHKNVYYLPFGVQPRLYNPIATIDKSVFAAYLPPAANESTFISHAAKCFNADIIDINNLPSSFKKYYVVLFDSIEKYSPGDVYPLLYQLLACGVVNIIASYERGVQDAFTDRLLFVQSYDEAIGLLGKVYKDADYRERLSLLGQRFIFDRNTYTHRIDTIMNKLGYHNLKQSKPGVSIVCCTHMESFMNNIFENYKRQTYYKKELIIVLNNPNMDKSLWEEKAQQFSCVRIIQPKRHTSVGHCVNLAVRNACYEYIANFDHDDYYGPEYIHDSLNVFKYTDAGLIGKKTHYVYFEEGKTVALMLPGYEYKYVINIDGSSIVFKKEIFNKVHFIDQLYADIQFSLDCWNKDIKVYSCDKYNHVYLRAASKEHHAFKMSDDNLKALTYIIKEGTDDYISFAIV